MAQSSLNRWPYHSATHDRTSRTNYLYEVSVQVKSTPPKWSHIIYCQPLQSEVIISCRPIITNQKNCQVICIGNFESRRRLAAHQYFLKIRRYRWKHSLSWHFQSNIFNQHFSRKIWIFPAKFLPKCRARSAFNFKVLFQFDQFPPKRGAF